MNAAKLNKIIETQLDLAKQLYSAENQAIKLKESYELLTNIICTKHTTYDSVFFISDDGALGFRAIKFYNDSSDYRVGSYHPSAAEAYSEALCYM